MVEEIPPEAVNEKLANGVQVVDIRFQEQFNEGHIPGALNIPLPELPRRIDEVDWGDDIVVACPIGQSSIQAARLIESYEGVDEDSRVASLEGGYEGWEYDLEATDR